MLLLQLGPKPEGCRGPSVMRPPLPESHVLCPAYLEVACLQTAVSPTSTVNFLLFLRSDSKLKQSN
jgi:hypothetical protein